MLNTAVKFFALAVFATVLRAQEPSGAIHGSLRDSINRAPLPDARISVRGPLASAAVTSPSGEFLIERLPPGDYDISIHKPGYLDSSNGSERHTVHLAAGALTESVILDLTPLSSLEGAVLDDSGKPLGGVTVMVASRTGLTDKDGRFVFEDLVPGSYQVAVTLPHEIRSRNLVRDSAGDYYGYAAAQFYPGADDPRLAIPVVISPGVRLRNVDLRLRRSLLVEFTGRILDAAAREPIAGAVLQLIGAVDGAPSARNSAAADGSFRFSLVQPGSYMLAVSRPDRSPLPYLVPVEIGKAGAEDLPFLIPPFTHFEGSIRLGDEKQRWSSTASVTLRHRLGPARTAETRPDGTFEFDEIPAGEYTVEVKPHNLRLRRDLALRFFVSAIQLGAQNGFRKPVTIVENGNPPLDIQLTTAPAGITGKIIGDGSSKFYTVAFTALAPRRALADFIMVTSDFQASLGPGDYDVTAWPGGAGVNANKTCDETVRVTVRDGAAASITLRPCR